MNDKQIDQLHCDARWFRRRARRCRELADVYNGIAEILQNNAREAERRRDHDQH